MNQTELLKGTLSTIILRLLEERGRLYGYEIAQIVKERSGGQILIKEGSLYPALHKLLADGLIQVEEVHMGKRVRKYYHLTDKGKEDVSLSVGELLNFLKVINRLVTT